MDWNSPPFVESRRLIRKFFPECRAVIALDEQIDVFSFIDAMSWAGISRDDSCDPCPLDGAPDLGLLSLGGVDDADDVVYARLLQHASFSPSGRVVIIPDVYCTPGREPIICHSRSAIDRIREFEDTYTERTAWLFDNCSDSIFVYESGEAMVLTHDQRFFWAKSKTRMWSEDSANNSFHRSRGPRGI